MTNKETPKNGDVTLTPKAAELKITGHAPVLERSRKFIKQNPLAIAVGFALTLASIGLGWIHPGVGGAITLVAYVVGLRRPGTTREIERERL